MRDLTLAGGEANEPMDVFVFGETIRSLALSSRADEWISDYLSGNLRIVASDPSFHRKGGVQYPIRDEAPTTFVDNYGLLVISEGSFNDLNSRMTVPLPINRFRPNIVISGPQAYDEDYFGTLSSGDIELRFIELCYRCNLTTIDQATGEFGQEPLNTLSSYRKVEQGVKFGSYAAVQSGIGRSIRIGQQLSAEFNF